MNSKTRITLADVAARAGVSKMTASRALRGAGDVSAANEQKVDQAAREIGYVGNHLASSLSGQRSDLIGVVVPSMANIVFAEVLAGIADEIQSSGMQPVFGVTDYDLEKEYHAVRNMLSWSPAGLIVTGLDQRDDTRRLLEGATCPVVQIMDTDGAPVDQCVGFSQWGAGNEMAHALCDQGRKRFGYVGCNLDGDTRAAKRLAGFQKGLSDRGITCDAQRIDSGTSTTGKGRVLTQHLLSDWPDLDCIYYSNDDLAAGGVFHCLAHDISVPERVLIAGFNGLDLIESLPVSIATTQTPRRNIGRAAAMRVLRASAVDPQVSAKIEAITPTLRLKAFRG